MAGLVSRLFGRKPETRTSMGWSGGASFTLGAGGTGPVTPWQAEQLSTVVACVNAIAGGLATLPAAVYRLQADGRIEAPNHPVSRLLRSPNPHQTWPDWLEFTIAQALLWGNSVSVIESDGAGRPTALVPVPFQNVRVSMLPTGRLAYDITAFQTPWGGTGQARRWLDSEVFHLRDRTDDGFIGRSRISRAPDMLRSGLGLQVYSAKVWENAATPKGMIELQPGIKTDEIRRVESWYSSNYTGVENSSKPLFMTSGTKYTPMSISPEDAQVLASRQFSVIELCRLFNVPPPIVQSYEYNSFTNAGQASTWFATNTLTPWARKVEAEFARSVFADPNGGFNLEIDLSGLVRGDYATRWTANVAAVTAGILTANEVRAQEGYGPLATAADPPAPLDNTPPIAAAVSTNPPAPPISTPAAAT